ncbi:MAG: SIS domain-containing protein [Spirochaetales bacterium]|nr:SIS domain-containing protein [Spirochaetales bacterium]
MADDHPTRDLLPRILTEMRDVLEQLRPGELETFAEIVARAQRVFLCGAGRVGVATRALAMRLVHLGKEAHWVPDDTTPGIGRGDLLIANSGSGGSPSTLGTATRAKQAGAWVATITANPEGRIARLADAVVNLPAQTFKTDSSAWKSVLPMGSQFELCLWMVQDVICLVLMQRMEVDEASMIRRHRNLE